MRDKIIEVIEGHLKKVDHIVEFHTAEDIDEFSNDLADKILEVVEKEHPTMGIVHDKHYNIVELGDYIKADSIQPCGKCHSCCGFPNPDCECKGKGWVNNKPDLTVAEEMRKDYNQ